MNIIIGENLKELRKKKNSTQEDLAEFLTVSITAVSKWERGECYPDIEFLPRIASYYDISVDDLLGVSEIKKQERINEYEKKSLNFQNIGDMKSNLELWREARKEFPNDWDVLYNLMYALYWTKEKGYAREVIEIGEKILAESTRNSDKTSAIQVLCYVYTEIGDLEKAKRCAYMASHFYVSQEELLSHVLEGDEFIIHSQRYILDSVEFLGRQICCYVRKSTLKGDEKKHAYHKALQVYELLYEDGDFGFYACRLSNIYNDLSVVSADCQNRTETLDYLTNAAKYAIIYDTQGNFQHTSLLVNRMTHDKKRTTTSVMSNESYRLLVCMRDEMYNFCRDDERFVKLTEDLKKVAVSGE